MSSTEKQGEEVSSVCSCSDPEVLPKVQLLVSADGIDNQQEVKAW